MKIKNTMIFSYDFPHKKTQDFLVRLASEGYKINYCIAAPYKKLNIPQSNIHISPSHEGIIHPQKLCELLDIEYIVSQHESDKTINYIREHPVDIYIIAGARILNAQIIRAANNKILNIHPGLLPEVRGLDTLLWSIYFNVPIGITSHFISPRIDSGMFILKEKLLLKHTDTIIDISLRLLEKQGDILIKSLDILKQSSNTILQNHDLLKTTYNTKMSEELEIKTLKKFKKWLKKHTLYNKS